MPVGSCDDFLGGSEYDLRMVEKEKKKGFDVQTQIIILPSVWAKL